MIFSYAAEIKYNVWYLQQCLPNIHKISYEAQTATIGRMLIEQWDKIALLLASSSKLLLGVHFHVLIEWKVWKHEKTRALTQTPLTLNPQASNPNPRPQTLKPLTLTL